MFTKGKKLLAAIAIAAAAALVGIGSGYEAPVTAYAEEKVSYLGEEYILNTSGDWQYIVKDRQVVIMGNTSTTAAITVPSEIAGCPVVAIGKNSRWDGKGAFQDNNSMQTVTIPASVTYIDESAFQNCTGLQQVLIGDGTVEIGKNAFADCSYMQRVQIKGATLKTIGEGAFKECAALDNVKIPESVETIGQAAFIECTALSEITIPDSVTTLGGGAFAGCTSLAEAVVGNGVTQLAEFQSYAYDTDNTKEYTHGAFENCTALTKVTIGTSVESIGVDCFAGTPLASVEIPDNVVTIGMGAFYHCTSMKTAQIGDGVKEIGQSAFEGCTALESISIGKRVRTIGDWAFCHDISLKELAIPSNVLTLGGGCFYGCSSMTKAVIGNGVQGLPAGKSYSFSSNNAYEYTHGCFENCLALAEVEIGDGVTSIGFDAFAGTALVNVEIPDSVITIENGAFYDCDQLVTVNIGDGVTTIGEDVFAFCDVLKNVHIGKGVVSIGARAFMRCAALPELLIPSNVTNIGGALCFDDPALKRVLIGNGVTELLSWQSYSYSSKNAKEYTHGSFEDCGALADVALGSGLTLISTDTFGGTAVGSLLVPAKVSEIEKGAFHSDAFQNIYFVGPAPKLESLFATKTPGLWKMAGRTGYDDMPYLFNDFTPVKVTFDLNDSDVFAIQPNDQYLSPDGGYVIEPIDPAAEGYRFLGWYKDSACTAKWDFMNDRVSADTTIYANWEKSTDVAPQKPTGLSSTAATGSTVTVNWQAVDGAQSYDIYVDGKEVAANLAACTYTITGLELDSSYEVAVVAVNQAGTSGRSLVKVVQTSEVDDSQQLGDVDGNGRIEATDALNVLRNVVHLRDFTDAQKISADTDGNGRVEAKDALEILRYVVHLIDRFPAQK